MRGHNQGPADGSRDATSPRLRPPTAWLPATVISASISPRAGIDRLPVSRCARRAPGGGDQPCRAPRHAAELPARGDREPRGAGAGPRQRAVRADARLCGRGAAARAAPLRPGRQAERGRAAVLLPGADGPRGEIVARRALERLRAIKVEADGTRRPLRVSVGLAAWRTDVERRGTAGPDARRRPAAKRTRDRRDAENRRAPGIAPARALSVATPAPARRPACP